MTKTFEIMFEDLSFETQVRLLEFYGMNGFPDGNFKWIPIATIEIEMGEDEE